MPLRRVGGTLVLYSFQWPYASNLLDHARAIPRHSRHPSLAVNVRLGFPPLLARLRFDAVVLHYSLFGTVPYDLDGRFAEYVDACTESFKVAFFQDDYRFCNERFEMIDRLKLDCVYTLIEPRFHAATFLKYTRVPKVVYTLPAYVSDDLIAAGRRWARPDEERRIDIGYRGRDLPYYLGAASQDKTEIAAGFLERSRELDLTLDVSIAQGARIYGDDWYRFLGGCRASLGVEGGASLVDVDGVVYREWRRIMACNPEASWDEFKREARPVLDEWDYRITDLTISARIFEMAALKSTMILFEGHYAGMLEPGRHYIPLRKDFANFEDVITQFRDKATRAAIARNAHTDLIASGEYGYERFVREFEHEARSAGALQSAGESVRELAILRAGQRRRAAETRLRYDARRARLSLARRSRVVSRCLQAADPR